MKKFEPSNDNTWDTSIKVGDLITAYNSGFFEVTDIEYRLRAGKTIAPTIFFTKRFNKDGAPSRDIKDSCDASWCRHAGEAVLVLEENIANLKVMIATINMKAENHNVE